MEMIAVYVTGGLLYGLIELLWRGWTHWSMLLCGGACFALMYQISLSALTFPWKCLLSACVITAVEFVTGCLVNIILKWQVWDYSSLPGNLWGQICPQFFSDVAAAVCPRSRSVPTAVYSSAMISLRLASYSSWLISPES